MMDVPENHMLLCQLTPELQYYDFSFASSDGYDLIWKMVSIILHDTHYAYVVK